MSSVIPITFEGAFMRTIVIDGEPYFAAKDVADPMNATTQHRKEGGETPPLSTSGGNQDVRVLSEPDVLRLIVNRKLPAAEQFKRWVFKDVLPAIRKTGSYGRPPAGSLTVLADPVALRGLLLTDSERVQADKADCVHGCPVDGDAPRRHR